ncbi:MAG: CDP-alcohol phosphatidyltransferase family protein [Thermoplasmatota archaeon]
MGLKAYLNAALRDEWDGLERITRDIRPADVVTMSNAVVGLIAILVAREDPTLAGILILVGILLDGADGAVARLGGGGGPLGGFLDALSDVVTFAVAPAVLLASVEFQPATVAVGAFFLVAVTLRLARFEALRETKDSRYFSGLSSPGGALLIVSAVLLRLDVTWLLAVGAVSGLLMISRIRYPKLRGWLGIVAVLLILATVIGHIVDSGDIPVWGMLGFMAFYVLAGPFYVLARIGPTHLETS